jgi:hypoxanthine phosphoribosyltransferase
MTINRYVNLLILLLIHYSITNVFEKVFVQQYIGEYKRPDSEKNKSTSSLGMPSGHVETTTILCFILEYYNVISIEVAIFIIIVMALQRILSKRHTTEQTIMGFFMGVLYAAIYINTDVSLYSIAILFVINLILIAFIETKVVSKMKNVPDWVDKELLTSIEKKQNCEKIFKFVETAIVLVRQNDIFYYSYKDLEKDLDIFSDKIKFDKIDCIVGIKTGGAICVSYLAKKLNKPYYFIKPESKKYLKKQKSDTHFIKRCYIYIYENIKKVQLAMREIITDDIKNQHVLLIDESVGTGSTMNASIDYLYKEKGVSKVSSYIFENNPKFNSVIDDKIALWPWGFDN